MRYVISAACIVACLVLAGVVAHLALPPMGLASAGESRAGEAHLASLKESAFVRAPRPDMSPMPQTAQMRCPAGQLVFLSSHCGCNGACCACSLAARYLNHCTCQCQDSRPPPGSCRVGFSVGSQ